AKSLDGNATAPVQHRVSHNKREPFTISTASLSRTSASFSSCERSPLSDPILTCQSKLQTSHFDPIRTFGEFSSRIFAARQQVQLPGHARVRGRGIRMTNLGC